jgi:hypothetical protein
VILECGILIIGIVKKLKEMDGFPVEDDER